jgi:hypothetical protein
MGLITIPKSKVTPVADPLLSSFAAEIDLVGRLTEEAEPIQKKIAELQLKLKPLADAQTALAEKIDQLEIDDDAELTERGVRYEVQIGARGKSRFIKDLVLAKKFLGAETFMKVATITLKNVDDYLTLPQRNEVLDTKRTAHKQKLVKRAV